MHLPKLWRIDEIKQFVYFESLFIDPCPLCKYGLLEKKNPFCLLHNWVYMNVIFLFIFYLLLWYFGIFDIDCIICKEIRNFQILFLKKLWGKISHLECSIFYMKI
jgi:hypothetical protein